jgi:cold shock CspA family protein
MASHRGTVVAFDAARGLGIVEDPDGTRLDFHCTALTDGSRAVPEGAAVRYVVVPGLHGRWEADRVEVLGAA